MGSICSSPFQDRADELQAAYTMRFRDSCGFQMVQMERETFYSPLEQLEISYFHPKNQGLSVAPESIFQLWVFFPSATFPSPWKQLQVILLSVFSLRSLQTLLNFADILF